MSRVVASATRQVPRLGVGRGNLTSQLPTSSVYLPVPGMPLLFTIYTMYTIYVIYMLYIVLYSIIQLPTSAFYLPAPIVPSVPTRGGIHAI